MKDKLLDDFCARIENEKREYLIKNDIVCDGATQSYRIITQAAQDKRVLVHQVQDQEDQEDQVEVD